MEEKISLELAFDFVNRYSQILPNEQFILLTFIRILGQNYKGQIHISGSEVAKLTGIDARTVQRHVAKLKLRNIITVEHTYIGDGHNAGSNKYTLTGWQKWVEDHV